MILRVIAHCFIDLVAVEAQQTVLARKVLQKSSDVESELFCLILAVVNLSSFSLLI